MKLRKLFTACECTLTYFELRRRSGLDWVKFNNRLNSEVENGFLLKVDEGYIIEKL